ncbi:MAG: hypothetical protein DLM64_00285 [Solirubrobacterales bacterium]|nr:MAG: hypothetical protein DLM64_00285 [Solirubrobacterales bacterium]
MPRLPGHVTSEGQRWFAELYRRQLAVDAAVGERDELARQALEHGLGIRGVAKALRIDKTTAQRRYGGRDAS